MKNTSNNLLGNNINQQQSYCDFTVISRWSQCVYLCISIPWRLVLEVWEASHPPFIFLPPIIRRMLHYNHRFRCFLSPVMGTELGPLGAPILSA